MSISFTQKLPHASKDFTCVTKFQDRAWHAVGDRSIPTGGREGRRVRMAGTLGRREAYRQRGLGGDRRREEGKEGRIHSLLRFSR